MAHTSHDDGGCRGVWAHTWCTLEVEEDNVRPHEHPYKGAGIAVGRIAELHTATDQRDAPSRGISTLQPLHGACRGSPRVLM